MKSAHYIATLLMAVIFFSLPLSSEQKFDGTWCVNDEGLVISFLGDDSLSIASLRDESVSGRGTYSIQDTILVASIQSEELTMEMGYHYKWRTDSLVRARITHFTLNGDSVNHPHHWLKMMRCENPAGTQSEKESSLEKDN
ncbi:MAG: hypothetical protein ACLFSB_11025 [Chitinispirillaceae bacterium]